MPYRVLLNATVLSELIDIKSQLRLQIACFVLVNDIHFSQFINHFGDTWIHSNSFCFVCS